MSNNNKEDRKERSFNIEIPLEVPTPEEVEAVKNSPKEKYIQTLIDSGYMTDEEFVAYIRFVSQLSGITPYLLDPFLRVYRDNK